MSESAPAELRTIAAFLREPLLHFALLGLALFVLFMLASDDPVGSESVVVSAAQQRQLAAAFGRAWQRPPSAQEFKGLIDDWIREEVANREALALGFDNADPIIRRRLRQKYESFSDQLANSLEPTDKELVDWYAEHREDYREDARFSFRHQFYSTDRRENAPADAQRALNEIRTGAQDGSDPGDPLALPQHFEAASERQLASRFGQSFADALADLSTQSWAGPVASAYGYHLVLISSTQPASYPLLETVREAVLRDWSNAKSREARETLYERLLARYTVTVEALPDS
ncbi:MAG: hypothetical protein ACI87W_001649 [Halieaceae bacterium]